jgi:hypothetical protein
MGSQIMALLEMDVQVAAAASCQLGKLLLPFHQRYALNTRVEQYSTYSLQSNAPKRCEVLPSFL